jgi:poly-gamma-glutamate capsule biosynthesis protein CapA/YwtB (metallophosphatase superfamily)
MSGTIMCVGDLILDEPDPDQFFDPSRELLATADVLIGHVEVPHTDSRTEASTDVPAPPADPAALGALARAGFGIVTLAGNHIYDAGPQGVTDTVRHARAHGMATAGAGPDLPSAREPAIATTADGLRVAVLSYNCVGPRDSWATSRKPGAAYIHVLTHYELDYASPGGPPRIYTFAEPGHLAAMSADVTAARSIADVVIVALHKGIGHRPAELAMYESPVARAAIDAGADAVVAHHAHIMRGVEIYRGRPVFHGLGNFVTVTRALTPAEADSPERRNWARRRKELFGFTPDPTMPFYPFHPESRNTIIATVRPEPDGIRAGFIPCRIDDAGRPVPVARGDGGEKVADYLLGISAQAGFSVTTAWHGDRHVDLLPA